MADNSWDSYVESESGSWSTVNPLVTSTALVSESSTVVTVVAVTLVIILAIGIVFTLGILLDCRQQKMMEKKMELAKKMRSGRKNRNIGKANRCFVETDESSIAYNMEEPSMTAPPVASVQEIV